MADKNKAGLDEAAHGGGIGDIGRQPVDPSSQNTGETEPVIDSDPAGRVEGVGLETDDDAIGSDEDLDEGADDTQGQPL